MIKVFLWATFLILLIHSIALTQERYLLFEENFDDNSNEWLLGVRAKTTAQILNGRFYFESKNPRLNYSRRTETAYLRNYQDFEIEINFRQVSGSNLRGYALEWGGNSIDNTFYEFWLRNDGSFSIDKFNGITEHFTDYQPWKKSEHIKIDDFNLLRVKKTGSVLRYFINNHLVFEHQFEKVYGNEIGFITPPSAAIEVDFIKIDLVGHKPEPIVSKEQTPNIYAIIIGIADYKNNQKGLSDLTFTTSDAIAMAKFYNSPNGGDVPAENIKLLLNEHATYQNIIQTTKTAFEQAKKDDLIVFYYAGHGTVQRGINQQLLHLLPHDYQPGNPNTSIVFSEIQELFNLSNASKKLWILDACHSGGTLENLNGNIKERLGNLNDKDIAIITSSNVNETSLEISGSIRRGLFSYYLTHGLITESNISDTNNDGIVDILELFNYTQHKTSSTAKSKYSHNQNPQIGGKFNVQLPLANVTSK
ncbi:MAG: caspase family protein [Bacteroidota bacterium]